MNATESNAIRATARTCGDMLMSLQKRSPPNFARNPPMTNPAYEATNSDERDAFEIAFPLPKHAIRCGSGYACTDYNAWDAQKFVERWEGWKACALAKTPAPNGMMQPSNELAEMKLDGVKIPISQLPTDEAFWVSVGSIFYQQELPGYYRPMLDSAELNGLYVWLINVLPMRNVANNGGE